MRDMQHEVIQRWMNGGVERWLVDSGHCVSINECTKKSTEAREETDFNRGRCVFSPFLDP